MSQPDQGRLRQRQQDFAALCAIQEKLERRRGAPALLDARALAELPVECGAGLDIDDDEPIDVEPRFFLAGRGADAQHHPPPPPLEPIQVHRLRAGGRRGCDDCARDALADARQRARSCEEAAWRASRWHTHRYVGQRNRPAAAERARSADGSALFHYFAAGSYRMWPRGAGWRDWTYHPDVPHAIGTVYDMTAPRAGAILRSELLFAVSLLKASVHDATMFIRHRVCPILVASFHGRLSARILQVHLDNGRMVVRPSRLLNLHTRAASRDVGLAIRWLDCKPVGDTRWPGPDPAAGDEAARAESGRGHPPTQGIAVV